MLVSSTNAKIWLVAILLICLVLTRYAYNISQVRGTSLLSTIWTALVTGLNTNRDCRGFETAKNTLVILKTGATEMHRKLPVHFSTTLRCIPHYVLYADVEDEVSGHKVLDSLDEVSDDLRKDSSDFELYRELQKYRNSGHGMDTLALADEQAQQAWNLDKWKFLPLIDKALKAKADAEWYVFIEADTCLLWTNLFKYLSHFDSTNSYYIGGQALWGDTVFGHGGTGFVLSNSAMRRLSEERAKDVAKLDKMTAEEWAGDLVLAKVLKQIKIPLTKAWPIFQGETPSTLDYTARHWCSPVASYHHMSTEEILSMYGFEQAWQRQKTSHPNILHRDVFEFFVKPVIISERRENWDNLSNDEEVPLNGTYGADQGDPENCRQACMDNSECLQYVHAQDSCKLSKVIKLGNQTDESSGLSSGWIMERINEFQETIEPCVVDWIP